MPPAKKEIIEDLGDHEVMKKIIQGFACFTTILPENLGRWSYAPGKIKEFQGEETNLEGALGEGSKKVETLTVHEESLSHELVIARVSLQDDRDKMVAYNKELYEQRNKINQEIISLKFLLCNT